MKFIPHLVRNPVTRKRLRRFRQNRRAWFSFILLAFIYLIGLCADLLCNDKPLYLRFEGHSFFPLFRYYPEDTFLHNGRKTRTDYRKLHTTPEFLANPANRIYFPIHPHGPFATVDPASLQLETNVNVTLSPVPMVASFDINPAWFIVRQTDTALFFNQPLQTSSNLTATNLWHLDAGFQQAIAARFSNKPDPATLSAPQPRTATLPGPIELYLPEFTPRRNPPSTVRITIREPTDRQPPRTALRVYPDSQSPIKDSPPLLRQATPEQRDTILSLARQALSAPVAPLRLTIDRRLYSVAAARNDVIWPYKPCREHPLGIDNAGRDVLARLIHGLRTSMNFGLLLVALAIFLGIVIGALQGFYGGITDILAQRFIEIWSALPFLYIMMLMGSVYGRSFSLLLFCYAIFNWIGISYYVRAEFLRLRRMPFVDAAKCMGIPPLAIMVRHILPNAMTPVITFFPFYLVGAIGSLAALDYLGFGLPPPAPSWGELLQQAQEYSWAWWLILYPSAALFVVMLLGVFIGEGVRDAFDPRQHGKLQ